MAHGKVVVRVVSTQASPYLTPEQYLEIERAADFKSEYCQGQMFSMSGAREAHNVVAVNVTSLLHQQLRARTCRVYSNDMRVCVSPSGLYTYPDVVIICTAPEFLDDTRDTLLNPTVIIEVLSPGTEAYDRGRKFAFYRTLASLREYVLVASERMLVERYAKQPDGQWLLKAVDHADETIELEAAGCSLRLSDVYEKVDFEQSGLPR